MFYWFLRSVTLCGNPPTTIVVRPPFDKGGKGTNTPSNNNLSVTHRQQGGVQPPSGTRGTVFAQSVLR